MLNELAVHVEPFVLIRAVELITLKESHFVARTNKINVFSDHFVEGTLFVNGNNCGIALAAAQS